MLLEPTPNREERRALLFYEAAEGGAGALSQLIADAAAFRNVALRALEIMHYEPASFDAAIAQGPGGLKEVADSRCVAGCYRCLLSYYNQPDHASIDRQQDGAKEFLLRLANPALRFGMTIPETAAMLAGCPRPDATALEVGGLRVHWIWRSARVAAVESVDGTAELEAELAAKGIELVLLPADEPPRAVATARLAALLGGGGQ